MCQGNNQQPPVTPPLTDAKLFELLREQIRHEDNLINNRVTWLLTLQGFLFSAYGFSLSAQATAANSASQKVADVLGQKAMTDVLRNAIAQFLTCALYDNCTNTLFDVIHTRIWISRMGLAASLILLFGTGAASISIIRAIRYWEMNAENSRMFPPIAGTDVPKAKAYAGLLPTYLIPIATAFAWTGLVTNSMNIGMLMIVVLTACIGLFMARNADIRDVSAKQKDP